MTLVFQSNADFFLKFYERCMKENITDEKERVQLLLRMAEEDGKCSVIQTERTKDQIAEDAAKHYKTVLKFNKEDKSEEV